MWPGETDAFTLALHVVKMCLRFKSVATASKVNLQFIMWIISLQPATCMKQPSVNNISETLDHDQLHIYLKKGKGNISSSAKNTLCSHTKNLRCT